MKESAESRSIVGPPATAPERSRREPRTHLGLELLVVALVVTAVAWWCVRPVDRLGEPSESARGLVELPRPGRFELAVAGDDDLRAIALAGGVRELLVEDAAISNEGLQALEDCADLFHLRLRQFEVDDAAAELLGRMSQLRFLNLPQANLSDQGLTRLAAMPHLELLRIGSRRISDSGLAVLQHATRLKFLHLIDVPLTDEGLVWLERLPKLESLYLDGAQVSDDAVMRLLAARPDLHLHLDQQHHDRDPRRADHDHP